jgi:hypothetical protein
MIEVNWYSDALKTARFFAILVLIAFYLHIYSASIDLLYYSNIFIPVFFLILLSSVLGIKKKIDKEILIFIPFLLALSISVFSLNFNVDGIKDIAKYLTYILCYFFIIKKLFCRIFVFRFFIFFLTSTFIFMFLLYVLALSFNIHLLFTLENLGIPNNSSYFIRTDWEYSLPFYILSFPINIPENGLLGIPRFYGFSTEPTLYSIVILPCVFMAYKLRMYISSLVLLFAVLVSSSYGAILVFFVSLVGGCWVKFRRMFYFIVLLSVIFVFIMIKVENGVFFGDSDRFISYSMIISNSINLDFSFFGYGKISDKRGGVNASLGLFEFFYRYGFIFLLSYLFIIYYFFKKACAEKDFLLLAFFISAILMVNKSSEILSPLLLFYFSFIEYSRSLSVKEKKML